MIVVALDEEDLLAIFSKTHEQSQLLYEIDYRRFNCHFNNFIKPSRNHIAQHYIYLRIGEVLPWC